MTDVRARRDFDGGTFKLATVDEWPISKTMSGGLMVIKPGQIKELLHWHPNANEFHFYLSGKGQVALFGSGGRGKVAAVKAGDSAYIPAGYGHGILNTGDGHLEIIQTWDAGKFEEITLKHWMATAPTSSEIPGGKFRGLQEPCCGRREDRRQRAAVSPGYLGVICLTPASLSSSSPHKRTLRRAQQLGL